MVIKFSDRCLKASRLSVVEVTLLLLDFCIPFGAVYSERSRRAQGALKSGQHSLSVIMEGA